MKTYTADKLAALGPTHDHSRRYWREQARSLLSRYPQVRQVAIAANRTEAIAAGYLSRGGRYASKPGTWLIIASTGGKWGRSREDLPSEDLVTI